MSEVQRNHKYTKPKAVLSKSTFLLFDSSLPRRYYNILSALDYLALLGCNHQLSQKQSHFKTRMRFSCPHVICTWTSTHTFTCCATNAFTQGTEHTEGVQRQRCMLSPTCHVCRFHTWQRQDQSLAQHVPPSHPHAQRSKVFSTSLTRATPT